MRHQQKGFRLGRTAAHRKATLSAMSTALIKHKRITTTHAKAKALRVYVEPLISRAKDDTTHNRRQVFRRLQDKYAVTELFGDIATRVGERPGGYTRIVKIGQRGGDSASMAIIELVDYNDVKPTGAGGTARKTRRSRSRKGAGKATAAASASAEVAADHETDVVDEVTNQADVVDDVTDDAMDVVEAADDTVSGADAATDLADPSEGVSEITEEGTESTDGETPDKEGDKEGDKA